jgi:hypothetical protein
MCIVCRIFRASIGEVFCVFCLEKLRLYKVIPEEVRSLHQIDMSG